METVVVKGVRGDTGGHSINFANISDNIRLNYTEIVLKSKLTEYLQRVSQAVYKEYEIKLDLINIVDNIVKQIDLENFVNVGFSNNHIFILGNMIYNEIYRMIVYLRTLYTNGIDYDNILNDLGLVKNDISKDVLFILGKSV